MLEQILEQYSTGDFAVCHLQTSSLVDTTNGASVVLISPSVNTALMQHAQELECRFLRGRFPTRCCSGTI